jgi:enterochelin esterase-like enzyme
MSTQPYAPVEISDARYESGGIRHVTYASPAISRRQDMLLVLPESGAERLPLLVLLHGVDASHWSWAYLGGVHETLERLVRTDAIPPLALALPSDGLWRRGSGYIRHNSGGDYERLVLEAPEVASLVDGRIDGRSPLGIAGLSMGGYGALRIGVKHCERFAAVCAHSAVTELAQLTQFVGDEVTHLDVDAEDADVLHWVIRHRDRLPPLRFDCGVDDSLIEANRALHRELERLGVEHEYAEHEGGHDWQYWGERIADSLRFFAAQAPAR